MMRRSVQLRLCFGLSALAVVLAAGLIVLTGAGVGGGATVGAVAAAGAESDTAGGRSEYFGASVAGAASLICVVTAVADIVVCGAELCSPEAAKDRLRDPPAWAAAEARSMAATRMILRM